jgi:hypothetical protein
MVKKRVNMMLEEDQFDRLKELSRVTRIRMSEFIREGVDWILAKYQRELKKGRKKGG